MFYTVSVSGDFSGDNLDMTRSRFVYPCRFFSALFLPYWHHAIKPPREERRPGSQSLGV